MNLSMKCMKLDYLLLKPYLKSMLLVLLVPLLITFLQARSLRACPLPPRHGHDHRLHLFRGGKNSMERFYGFLPAKKAPWLPEDT